MRLEKSNQWVKIFCRQRLDSLYNRAVVVPESFVQFMESGRKENTMPATVEFTGDIARLVLSGDFDFSAQENLSHAIDEVLRANAIREIQVDLIDATFIDSSVIRALLKLREAALAGGKSLSLWNCNEYIREIFTIGGFDQLFVMH
jgi:anti-anti-sigma factor